MLSTNPHTGTPDLEPGFTLDSHFDFAHGELRRALIGGIAHRVGKTVDAVSIEEACSNIPLAELYHRKLRSNRFVGVVERLFRWWR
jgi:hypothetical protein